VKSVLALRQQPGALLVTGDLAHSAADVEYERVRDLLAPLTAPVYVLPGNHDDRATLRRQFAMPGAEDQPIWYSVDLGPLRLVVLDSTIPGDAAGALGSAQLAWLERILAASPDQPTLIALHHPPLVTGVPAWDEIGLVDGDRQLLAEVLERHRQVRRIVAGHLHRTIAGELAGRSVLAAPSTSAQARLDFSSREFELAVEPAGFAVHAVVDGDVTSHLQAVV
jgi:3',5'-cyclic AMP phosphodiesterase CpdA